MKIGVFGGTFDPIHLGHLAAAEEVRLRLSLESVLFVPTGQPWLKSNSVIAPAPHRVEMVRLAIACEPYFKLSTVEVERPGPSYTVDTLLQLRQQYGEPAEFYFVLGWDSLTEVPRWHEPARLIDLCWLVAVPRPGSSPPDLPLLESKLPGISRRVILLNGPRVDISATDIRERAAKGLPISHLVAGPVAEYIEKNGLYRSAL